jgi:hypothetical protein
LKQNKDLSRSVKLCQHFVIDLSDFFFLFINFYCFATLGSKTKEAQQFFSEGVKQK